MRDSPREEHLILEEADSHGEPGQAGRGKPAPQGKAGKGSSEISESILTGRLNHRAGDEEERALDEGVSQDVEGAGSHIGESEQDDDVAVLRDRRVGQQAVEIHLCQRQEPPTAIEPKPMTTRSSCSGGLSANSAYSRPSRNTPAATIAECR